MTKPLRIGILGGTFDPIHEAHLAMARAALATALLDSVLFMVASIPPHKQQGTHASALDRLAMVEAALRSEPQCEASSMELDREGPSYTADTLRDLTELYPEASFFLILGEDSLVDFPKWRETEAILAHARLLVLPRPGSDTPIHPSLEGHYERLPFQASTISSTTVRQALHAGESTEDSIPESVMNLIDARGLYGR